MDTSPYLSLFLQECRDNCAAVEEQLLAMERDGVTSNRYAEVMRLCHSCKGAAATMQFVRLTDAFHLLEDVFSAARDGKIALDASAIDMALRSIDALRQSLVYVEENNAEPQTIEGLPDLHVLASGGHTEEAAPAAAEQAVTDELSMLPHIRVDARKLDFLLDLAGELSLLRQQFRTLADQPQYVLDLDPLVSRLEKNTQELLIQVNESRLIPLDQAFARLPRLVRDTARSQLKEVTFTMQGTDISLDKSIVDHLVTPLVHLLRNAVDHGIETPAERLKAGKPEQGTVTLSVRGETGFVVVSVEDDGQAIELNELKKLSKNRGFSDDEIESITEETILDLLCSSRFSSSQTVSMVSGRGVGLSAVKQITDGLGGHLSLVRQAGGKRFELALPLQLSIIPIILVRVGEGVYGVPFVHVDRLLQLSSADTMHMMGKRVLDIEGQPLPVRSLATLLHKDTEAIEEPRSVLVLSDGNRRFGIAVDEIIRNQEMMMKPLTSPLRSANLYAGCSPLGDGKIALVLDVPALIQHAFSIPVT
ncbi:MAG: Signal transduction histidine kinase CheA [Candidatus Peribacteria bacterium]|nr:Signal transduction histidine kinase CheA [Candidatus Peribacteria bacterium]